MEKYLDKDAETLEELLAACGDFKERRNIREALRELKGLKLDGDKIVTYSFGADTVKRLSSLKFPKKNTGRRLPDPYSLPSTSAKQAELENHAKLEANKNGFNVSSPVEERFVENPKYTRNLYAGNISESKSDAKINSLSQDLEGNRLKEVDINVPNERLRNTWDVDIVSFRNNTRPDSLNLNGIKDASGGVRYDNQTRKIRRSQSSPFSPTGFLSPISKTVSRLKRTETRTSEKELVPNDKGICDRKLDKFSDSIIGIDSEPVMKTQESRRNFSESSVPSPRNELSWTDEVKKERSKSCNNENDFDIDGVRIRKKPTLSRKNRVEADWNMSPRLSSKFRKKHGSVIDSFPTTTVGSLNDSICSSESISEKCVNINGDVSEVVEGKVSRNDSAKRPPTHRKLPDIPVQVLNGGEESDETVHERTLRLLQERRKLRRAKFKLETEAELKQKSLSSDNVASTDEKTISREQSKKKEIHENKVHLKQDMVASSDHVTSTDDKPISKEQSKSKKKEIHEIEVHLKQDVVASSDHVTSTDEKPKSNEKPRSKEKLRSKKKEIRMRREQQLLNRTNESTLLRAETHSPGKTHKADKTDVEEKKKTTHPVRRSKSDMVRSKPPLTPESAAQKIAEMNKEEVPVVVDVNGFDAMTPAHKIDMIGSLMQEEAKLQETLRRTTSFSDRRKIRSEVRQLRDKRTALEGSPEAQPVSVVQRSASLSAGDVTPSAKTSGEVTQSVERRPSIEELRKQLSQTSDYDEKRKIRLALRQLRQQSRESDDGQGSKLQRSQSCFEIKSLQKPSVNDTKQLTEIQRSERTPENHVPQPDAQNSEDTTAINVVLDNDIRAETVRKRHSIAEVKTHSADTKETNTSGITGSSNKLDRQERVIEQSKVNINESGPKTDVQLDDKSKPNVLTNGLDIVNSNSDAKRPTSLNGDKIIIKDKVSSHDSSTLQHSPSSHSNKASKTHHSNLNRKHSTNENSTDHSKLSNTAGTKPVSERGKLSPGEEKLISKLPSPTSEKTFAKQRKYSLESLADSYRLRDQEDKKNRQFNSALLKNVIGKLEDKISKSPSKILISRANSESCLSKRLKDLEDKSKDPSIKQLKDSKNLLKIQQRKCDKNKEEPDTISKIVNGLDKHSLLNESKVKVDADKGKTLNLTKKENNNDRLSPNIPWLEDKIKSSPTPNELDKLMSTMDIEQAFSQILDDVDKFPVGNDKSEPTTPDTPIVPISEEESCSHESSASSIESANEEMDERKRTLNNESKHIDQVIQDENSVSVEVLAKIRSETDGTDSSIGVRTIGVKDGTDSSIDVRTNGVKESDDSDENLSDKTSAINSNSGMIKKSEAQIQLKSNLSLDLSPPPKENSAISVLHGDDGTVTVHEVSQVEEGDTIITEWKKLRRTDSRSEEYETDTIKETKVTSPRGTSSKYEKDVSKTKRKITSRGSEYFSRSNYNITRRKNMEGSEVVEQGLTSESENVSVSKNESWGSRAEAKLTLDKDGNETQHLKAITPEIVTEHVDDVLEPVEENGDADVFPDSAPSRSRCLAPVVHSSLSKTSSGYGSVSGSDEDDKDDVIETPLGRPSGCPTITSSLKEVSVLEGLSATLECTVMSSPLPTVTWYKGTNILQESERVVFQFDGVTGKASLKISDVTIHDLGEYRCSFNNPLGTAETKGNLVVKSKASGPPTILKHLEDVTVSEGCSIVLECEVSGVDSVGWYKDGIIQRDSADFKQTFDGSKARLEIGEVFLDDDGTYTCAVKNSTAECKSSCKVNITEAASDDIVAPAFLKKLESQIVDENDLVMMECDIIGSPQPIISWYCENKALQEGGRIKCSYDGRVARLIMKNASKGDNGKYECVAQSSAGRISCDCILVVKDLQTAPSVIKPLSDLTVNAGKTAILECTIQGNPIPEIAWRKNKRIIGHMLDFKQTFVDGVAKLEIGTVYVPDHGCYECVATNQLGETTSTCNLLVTDKPIVSQSQSNTQKEEVTLKDEDVTSIAKAKDEDVTSIAKAKVTNFPSGFTAITDDHQAKAAKSQASKIMLVCQSSLRSIDRDRMSIGAPVKRSESLRMARQPKKEEVSASKSDEKGSDVELKAEAKGENIVHSEIKVDVKAEKDSDVSEKGPVSKGVMAKEVTLDSDSHSEVRTYKHSEEKSADKTGVNDSLGKQEKVTSVSSIKLNNHANDVGSSAADSEKERISLHLVNSVERKSENKNSNTNTGALELDHNENIKLEEKPTRSVEPYKDTIKVEVTNKHLDILTKDIAIKEPLVNTVTTKEPEKTGISSLKTVKNSALSKFEKLCSDAEKEKPKFKSSAEVRRTQSVRAPGNEKPEWLQMKLRRIGDGTSPGAEKKISPLAKQPDTQKDLEKPTSVPNDIKLIRSNSARVTDRKINTPLNDSTNTPIRDRGKDDLKMTPVSERAKLFQNSKDSSPLLDRKNPTAIIGKALSHLSRTESLRAPVGHKSYVVQRSHSFKTDELSSTSGNGVTLDLTPPKNEAQEKSGELGVGKKPVQFWDPTTAPTTNMSYASMTDEEELHKLLASSDNFEERKKIRARIKELREIQQKEWDEKRKAHGQSEDLLKQRQRQADLEKQRKLEAFKVQAAQPHEQKHLEVREQRLKEKMREAEEQKQRSLETFDRLARKEDVTQQSSVHTEVRDGKTVTVRKTESVSKTAGVGGMSYGKPAENKRQGGGDNEKYEEDAEKLAKQLINSSSPAVSGVLSVKTESWSSKDGITHKSEKTESWGAKKPASAMNAFKSMDAKNNPQTNPLVAYTFAKKAATTMRRNAVTIKQDILMFCQQNTLEYKEKIEITNFSTSWNDGIAFCALIHHFYPNAFDFDKLDPKQRRANFELAFDTAEKYADIAPLLDVEDMVKMKKPDWKCVFTYVQSFYRKLKDHDMNRVK